jgi:hypothetical protein
MPGKKRTPTERAIIYAGILGGLSIEQINELLKPLEVEDLNSASYAMMKGIYFEHMITDIGRKSSNSKNAFGESIYHPKPMGDI